MAGREHEVAALRIFRPLSRGRVAGFCPQTESLPVSALREAASAWARAVPTGTEVPAAVQCLLCREGLPRHSAFSKARNSLYSLHISGFETFGGWNGQIVCWPGSLPTKLHGLRKSISLFQNLKQVFLALDFSDSGFAVTEQR